MTIKKQPAIPVSDTETPPGGTAPVPPTTPAQERMQAIANTAGFHFAMIEQGGSSLYTTMSLKVTSFEVLRIVVAIGGVETNHFSLWHDKCGNAVSPPLGGAVTDPKTGLFFPNLNAQNSEATQANLILPEPCEFIPGLPACSVVRPTIDPLAGAMAAIKAVTADGLFNGQSPGVLHGDHEARAGGRRRRARDLAVGGSILSPVHLAIVLVVVLLLFGAKRLPELGRSLGASMREFKESVDRDGSESHPPQAPQLPWASAPAADQEARHRVHVWP